MHLLFDFVPNVIASVLSAVSINSFLYQMAVGISATHCSNWTTHR